MKQLKTKFILLTMAALFVLLSFTVVGMNLLNYRSVVEEADTVLAVLAGNKGHFPGMEPENRQDDKLPPGLPPQLSPEVPYESRFFTVTYDAAGQVIQVDVNRITAIDAQKAILMAQQVKNRQGFMGAYRYMVSQDADGIRITFLDCGRKLEAFQHFCISSIFMSLLGFVAVLGVVVVMAGRIIRPIAESYEKQKRFITDAGHEIKTPLTIIHANADILEMELGDNESLADIKAQTVRLKHLTEDLVMLSRMEEMDREISKIEFPISEVVGEAAHDFQALFRKNNKVLQCSIEPMLTIKGEDKSIRQLVSILLENGLKYSPEAGTVALCLARQGRSIQLTVSNETEDKMEPEQLKYIFDRFYRTDASRNSETGGYGIGLSIAKAIVTAHNGKIKAATTEGKTFCVTATFPA